MLSSWHFTDKGIPQGNKDKICVQTVPLRISIICCLLCPNHPPTHPEDRQEADAAQFCAPNSCLLYYNRLCTLRADECILIWRSTTLLTPFQYKRHGCGATCRCVNSSLHLFTCFPGHFQAKPREEEVKSERCLSTSACMLLYWLLCNACCTLHHDFPDIWYLCTCYPLSCSEWVSTAIIALLTLLLLHSVPFKNTKWGLE